MKFPSALLVLSSLVAAVHADCTDSIEQTIGKATKLSFAGFIPAVNRISNSGEGNKIVLRGYTHEPLIEANGDMITISAGEPCDVTTVVDKTGETATDNKATGSDLDDGLSISGTFGTSAGVSSFLGVSLPLFFGRSVGFTSTSLGSAVLTTLALTMSSSGRGARAQQTTAPAACEPAPIVVDIYVDETVNDIVMMNAQSGNYEVCPPESTYWKHHPAVFGGYEGCVGENHYYPCPQDSTGLADEVDGSLAAKYPLAWDGEKCVETGYTFENRTFWILWGDPLDKYELNKRTGLNPVVSFPFNRGPYPNYQQGVDIATAYDDSADGRAAAKDFLVFIGAFLPEELEEFEVTFTEGAESGMAHIWAGKALEIARTTCNRDIHVLMEVPAYGYSNADSAAIVNKFASSFYNSSECLCFADDSCLEPTVTITSRGWLPLTPFPVATGGDGLEYAADSESPSSPWFESMVVPENPSGKIKIPQLAANRRVCDGVYLWPMYFGMRNYTIPMDERPDCSAWSFSITKAYSASVRAGFIIYKREPETSFTGMVDAIKTSYTMTNGLLSEWSWYGQMQLWDMIKSRPMNDTKSWIGAYKTIVEEKWAVILDAFEGCPVAMISNPRAGAYAWFVYKEPYLGLQTGFVATFFLDVLGVSTTTYNWGFRGANPADYYGPKYNTSDFTRLNLYRDLTVYEEVARRAKIVCNDLDASIGDFVSINDWAAAANATRVRKLSYQGKEHRERHLREVLPRLTDGQVRHLVESHEMADMIDEKVSLCAPLYTTSCLFEQVGTRFVDI